VADELHRVLNVPFLQQTPEALGDLQKAEIEKWWPILKTAQG
jgi:hypothetical protein